MYDITEQVKDISPKTCKSDSV